MRVAAYLAVTQHDVAARISGDVGIMGDEYYCTSFRMELLKQYKYLERRPRVKVSCRLVGQQHSRIVDQGTGYGHTLHLPTRHLV